MSINFESALRIVYDESMLAELKEKNMTVEDEEKRLAKEIENEELQLNTTFNAPLLEIVATGQRIHDASFYISGIFYIDGVLNVQTVAGDIIPIIIKKG